MYIPQKRDLSRKNGIFIICASIILFFLASAAISYFLARWLRQRHYEPKYIPGQYFKRKWKQWCPGSASYGQVYNPNAGTAENGTSYRGGGGINPEMTTADAANTNVRRETSIRSIITLPPYSASPKPTEQVVAREGERGGMDMVVEFPETQDEQETRREDQMDALYQLRVQRRQQAADRETRRNERRAARARGDSVRLEELAAESRARNNRARGESNTSLSASAVIAEHQARERDRRISSVSYADIGHVRHDGSRLRADSHDSDHHPLLQNASLNTSSPSLLTNGRCAPRQHEDQATHPPQTDEQDIGNLNIVPPPPEYDHLEWGDAPAYESPTRERAEQSNRPAPLLTRLPSIHVNIASPITMSPVFSSGLPPREDNNQTPTPPDSIPARSEVSHTQAEHTGSTDNHPIVSR
ncbi:hypothetical protein N7533_013650 [Penicillium manginii]|uniref:uncharacterized protein n=1 Tax=Penicillium manginii TaxID=203109 RepID=UPI002546E04D|nr:uncharacterized protein N7533_013650 [Penicillium manginii]KAJ5733203.1 hypothetical protein N7533_013650 [Penicillium manginii]